MGTPYYMSPEVVQRHNYNEKCDVWSLGVILYFMLTGVRPFDGKKTDDIFLSITDNNFIKSIFFFIHCFFQLYISIYLYLKRLKSQIFIQGSIEFDFKNVG